MLNAPVEQSQFICSLVQSMHNFLWLAGGRGRGCKKEGAHFGGKKIGIMKCTCSDHNISHTVSHRNTIIAAIISSTVRNVLYALLHLHTSEMFFIARQDNILQKRTD